MAQPVRISADSPATLGDLNAAVQALSDHFDGKLDSLESRLSDRFDGKLQDLSDRFDGKLDSLETRLSGRIDELSRRVDELSGRVDGLEAKLDAHARDTRRLLLVIVEKLFTPEEFEDALARQAERDGD